MECSQSQCAYYNDIEGWHSAISKYLRKHADIFSILKFFRDEENSSRHLLVQANEGREIKRPNKKYLEISKKIQN